MFQWLTAILFNTNGEIMTLHHAQLLLTVGRLFLQKIVKHVTKLVLPNVSVHGGALLCNFVVLFRLDTMEILSPFINNNSPVKYL